jgi:hypothetical protein
MMRFRALVDRWSRQVLVYFVEVPGCQVSVLATQDYLAAAPPVIGDYLRWLAVHGIADEPAGHIEVVVAEDRSAAGGIGAIFTTDLARPSPEYVRRANEVAGAVLEDLLDWQNREDPGKTVRLADSAGEPVTMAGVIRHLAEMDRYYLDSVGRGGLPPLPDDPAEAVRTTFREVSEHIDSAFIAANHRSIDAAGEEWTPMKLLRRRTGHVREHYPEIEQLLR